MKNNILSLQGITLLNKSEQKTINGGWSDPDGHRQIGNLCSGHGPAKNRCGSGLRCDVGGANIGVCVKELQSSWEDQLQF